MLKVLLLDWRLGAVCPYRQRTCIANKLILTPSSLTLGPHLPWAELFAHGTEPARALLGCGAEYAGDII